MLISCEHSGFQPFDRGSKTLLTGHTLHVFTVYLPETTWTEKEPLWTEQLHCKCCNNGVSSTLTMFLQHNS